MHKDISREVEALGQSDQEALDLWRETFNYERPHEALKQKTPASRYQPRRKGLMPAPELPRHGRAAG